MVYDYSGFWGTLLIITGVFFLALALNITFHIVFGQNFDPCFVDNDMYKRACEEQKIYELYDQLLNRTQEWNNIK